MVPPQGDLEHPVVARHGRPRPDLGQREEPVRSKLSLHSFKEFRVIRQAMLLLLLLREKEETPYLFCTHSSVFKEHSVDFLQSKIQLECALV